MLSTNNLLKPSLLFRFGCETLKNSIAALKEKKKTCASQQNGHIRKLCNVKLLNINKLWPPNTHTCACQGATVCKFSKVLR